MSCRFDFLQSSQLGGHLLEAWEVLFLHTNVKSITGKDDQSLEVSGSHSTSNVEKDEVPLVQGVSVVQFNGRVSHGENSRAVTSGEVHSFDHDDGVVVGATVLFGPQVLDQSGESFLHGFLAGVAGAGSVLGILLGRR